MTRTVADAALMMQAMSGEDASDPWSIGFPQWNFVEDRLRTAICAGARLHSASRRSAGRLQPMSSRHSSRACQAGGPRGRVEEMPADGFEVEPIWRAINHTAWRARFEKLAADHGDVLSETFMKQLALATKVSGVDYQRAMFDRTALFRRVQTLLQRVDILAMPTITRTALRSTRTCSAR